MQLQRVGDGPILTPRNFIPWEKDAVLNTAVSYDNGTFHLFYRAVAHNGHYKNRSCIGHAWSTDGVHFECADEPALKNNECPAESVGVEDPRITKIDDTYYMVYTAWDERYCRISLATSLDLTNWDRHGILFNYDIMGQNKNGAFFPEKIGGKYALLHRPMGFGWLVDSLPYEVWLSFSDDLRTWSGHRRILRTRRDEVDWEYVKVGIGGPPIKTDTGWLLVYHAVDKHSIYRLGLALLDLNNPAIVLKRTDEPILQPEADWELKGDVNNVVFTCGSVLLDNELWVYYGGADTKIGLAKGDVSEFLKI